MTRSKRAREGGGGGWRASTATATATAKQWNGLSKLSLFPNRDNDSATVETGKWNGPNSVEYCGIIRMLYFIAITAVAATTNHATFVLDEPDKLILTGGASVQAAPLYSLRSGNPGQQTSAAHRSVLNPGATVGRVSFSFRYDTGFGPSGVGANFTLRVAGHAVFSSPHLTDYQYSQNRSNYSEPVVATLGLEPMTCREPTRRLVYDSDVCATPSTVGRRQISGHRSASRLASCGITGRARLRQQRSQLAAATPAYCQD